MSNHHGYALSIVMPSVFVVSFFTYLIVRTVAADAQLAPLVASSKLLNILLLFFLLILAGGIGFGTAYIRKAIMPGGEEK